MKIAFICNSLEPGKDGVGDYTRRLAAELIKQGNRVIALALNDKYVNELTAETQSADNIAIPVTRIPYSLSKAKRSTAAKRVIDQFDPAWVSLQFVPFGFNTKGLPFGLGNFLLIISNGMQWHVMFHELWVGMADEESVKLKCWGKLQQILIRSLLIKLKPRAIHTQAKLYQALLKKMRFETGYLPLFGNIPVNDKIVKDDNKEISLVVFGSIHDGAPIGEFASEAALYSRKHDIPVTLTFIGRCGPEQDRWIKAWQAEGLTANIIGEQPAAKISKIFKQATMGISATALAVIEKSGAVAAMHDHGLPVLSVAKPWHPTGITGQPIPDGVIEYRIGNFETLMTSQDTPVIKSISVIAASFIKDLSNIS